eukprot:gene9332-14467_t
MTMGEPAQRMLRVMSAAAVLCCAAAISDGEYYVLNEFSGKALDVKDSSKDSVADVVVTDLTNSKSQRWTFDKLSDGSYSIINVNSGLGLDVARGSDDDGGNIIQYKFSGAQNQKFKVEEKSDGSVVLYTKHANKPVQVYAWEMHSGASVHQYKYTEGGENQEWVLVSVNAPVAVVDPSSPIVAGTYFIGNKWNGGFMQPKDGSDDRAAPVQVGEGTFETYQQWTFTPVGSGFWKIENVNSGFGLDVTSAKKDDSVDIVQYPYLDLQHQEFSVTSAGDGYVYIVSRHANKALEVHEWSTSDGASVKQFTPTGAANQQWRLIDLPVTEPPVTMGPALDHTLSGNFFIGNKWSATYLDVKDASESNGGNVEVNEGTFEPSQEWTFTHIGDGYYKIINVNSGRGLDVSGVSNDNGANIQQYAYGGGSNQEWKVFDADHGYVTIQSRHSGKMIELYEWDLAARNVKQYEFTGGSNQLWMLIAAPDRNAPPKNNDHPAPTSVYQPAWPTAPPTPTSTGYSGKYFIGNKYSGTYLDIEGSSKEKLAVAKANIGNFGPSQQWEIMPFGNGMYIFVNVNSGYALDVEGATKDDGGKILQYDVHMKVNQQFAIEEAGMGYVTIHTGHANKAMELYQWNPNDNADVRQWTKTGASNQHWMLIPVPGA